jgi:hypothetical protein
MARNSFNDHAVAETGSFASQVTVCKLRDEHTIEVLERAFRCNYAFGQSEQAEVSAVTVE